MRITLLLSTCATSAAAWEFTPGQPCLLSHSSGDTRIELTYDPTQPLYSVTVERALPWPEADLFAMRFEGPNGFTISTDRQLRKKDGKAVSVVDTGFGNVLNGLQYNNRVTAIMGDTTVSFSLDGAEEPVAAFRLCQPQAGA